MDYQQGPLQADVAELADALDLGSSGVTRGGSSPLIRSTQPVRSLSRSGCYFVGCARFRRRSLHQLPRFSCHSYGAIQNTDFHTTVSSRGDQPIGGRRGGWRER